ncbi:phage protein [Cytobacillus firmus]|uniref:DUF2800 domain-containing protein n=1 Tax=Cytobacillus firmus TaxID=1399 RepID=UPI0018CD16F9|nr:DUF2800 domain-containing protein [Cytobacillus firmus]MBG9544630.1 phage protein [Cytobacillus firmus]MBG9553624.1 phage protein [Cytobacillus firmus]MBG9577080.1 phage protein [Cytobacillus firmus]MED4448816.1 DUF2800 domain-containing protein [Cytobacillus firmus]MED4769347.1 DUF2800 domain-containing protein [Cytobacillus firmus]
MKNTVNHSERAHASLGASKASQWLACTPSIRLGEQYEETTSIFAKEGTFMHELSELYLSYELKQITKAQLNKKLKQMKQNEFYNLEIEQAVQTYVDIVAEKVNEARARSKEPLILIEERVDFSPWVPEGFGTGDVILISGDRLEIVDLKGGKGVKVSAVENPQMRLYALGAINNFGVLYDIESVLMTIVQPRLDNISTDEMQIEELLKWAENEVKPKADLAFKGEGDFVPGEHCRFCKVKANCRARAEENLKLACMDFQKPPLLTDDEVVEVLTSIDKLMSWAKDVQEFALAKAMNENKQWPGMKLVEGRGSRKYSDDNAVVEALTAAGFDGDVIFKKSLNTITTLEKELGKKTFQELLGSLITKAPGKVKLVPEEDMRQEIKSSPEVDFQ